MLIENGAKYCNTDALKDICEQWSQKSVLSVSTFVNKLFLKDAMEEETVILDKTETDVKVDLKITDYMNDMGKDMGKIMDRQMKLDNFNN